MREGGRWQAAKTTDGARRPRPIQPQISSASTSSTLDFSLEHPLFLPPASATSSSSIPSFCRKPFVFRLKKAKFWAYGAFFGRTCTEFHGKILTLHGKPKALCNDRKDYRRYPIHWGGRPLAASLRKPIPHARRHVLQLVPHHGREGGRDGHLRRPHHPAVGGAAARGPRRSHTRLPHRAPPGARPRQRHRRPVRPLPRPDRGVLGQGSADDAAVLRHARGGADGEGGRHPLAGTPHPALRDGTNGALA